MFLASGRAKLDTPVPNFNTEVKQDLYKDNFL